MFQYKEDRYKAYDFVRRGHPVCSTCLTSLSVARYMCCAACHVWHCSDCRAFILDDVGSICRDCDGTD